MKNEALFDSEVTTTEPLPQVPEPDEPDAGFNCANYLATRMLQDALGKSGSPFSAGLHIVVAPENSWLFAVKDATRDYHLGGCANGRKHRLRMIGSGRPCLQVFDLPSTADSKTIDQLLSHTQTALAQNLAAVVVAGSASVVPAALRVASDQLVELQAPQPRWVAAMVREIAPKARRVDFSDLACSKLTPAILDLAYRPNLRPRDFLQRLLMLTSLPLRSPNLRKPKPLNRLHGVEEATIWAENLKADLDRYRCGQLRWDQLSRGVLLSGPAGTAKTTCAQSVAEFCAMAFISTSYAEWQRTGDGHLGAVLRAMAAVFAEARSRKPCVILIDELDTLGARGGEGRRDDWWRSIINALLEQIDGRFDNEGVILVAATNHPELIDPAILRSGRIEDHIILRHPTAKALAAIFGDELEGELEDKAKLDQLGRISVGMTGADAIKCCKTARRHARNAGRSILFEDLLIAITGEESHGYGELLRAAIHETGHAIAALSFPELQLDHVTIVGRNEAAGGTSMGVRRGSPMTASALDVLLVAIVAGRAAEEVLLGEISAGSGGHEDSDLARATQLAAQIELSLGMGRQGLIWYAPPARQPLTSLLAQRPDLARSVRDRLARAYSQACELIKTKAPLVRMLAEKLMTAKVLTGQEMEALIHDMGQTEMVPFAYMDSQGRTIH